MPANPPRAVTPHPLRVPGAFDAMWQAYPRGTPDEVKTLIGGLVNAKWIANTCAIRMSRSFNQAGAKIPWGRRLKTGKILSTVSGADKLRYAYRVQELKQFFLECLGPPTRVAVSEAAAGIDEAQFQGEKGVLVFDVNSWSNATGHIDLWDGAAPAGHAYFADAQKVSFWAIA